MEKYQKWEAAKEELKAFENTFTPTPENEQTRQDLRDAEMKLYKSINSYLTRYGMISLRSDGKNMILAQKLEKDSHWGKYDLADEKFFYAPHLRCGAFFVTYRFILPSAPSSHFRQNFDPDQRQLRHPP